MNSDGVGIDYYGKNKLTERIRKRGREVSRI